MKMKKVFLLVNWSENNFEFFNFHQKRQKYIIQLFRRKKINFTSPENVGIPFSDFIYF